MFIKWFDQLNKRDIPLVGGKCANIGELMVKVGVPVPNGFAITARGYKFYLKKNKVERQIRRQLRGLDTKNVRQLMERGAAIRQLIRSAEMPPSLEKEILRAYKKMGRSYVSVRSSATAEDLPGASFAGQQETYLNVIGNEELIKRVKDCFASLFTNRAISYRVDKKFSHFKVAISVAVQKMVRSDLACSGVVFTIDPDSGHPSFVMLNGSWGLGDYIVQGKVNPDTFLVFKPSLTIIEKILGKKRRKLIRGVKGNVDKKTSKRERASFILSDKEIKQLADWCIKIERHYKMPMDIEWAKDGVNKRLYVLQARPETVHALRKNVIETYRLKGRGKLLVRGEAVGRKIGHGKVNVIKTTAGITSFRRGQVLVTEMTGPDWEPIMKFASAIVTDRGGRTCHAAIVSRELGIPCVIGTGNATKKLREKQKITVDCSEGEGRVYDGFLKFKRRETNIKKVPKTGTKIYVNVGVPEEALDVSQLPVDGVGLARIEFIITSYVGTHPMHLIKIGKPQLFVDQLARGIAKIAASFYPRPVVVRFSDFKTNEYANLKGGKDYEPKESNPMLGWRGASRYYDKNYLPAFKLECRALKKVREEYGLTNVWAMIPFCRTPKEGKHVVKIMKKEGLKRGSKGFKVWCMVEVPSNIILADKFAKIFDGFSIGSNDLTQLILGADRDSEQIAKLFDERNEAVKRAISGLIKVAHKHKKKVSICGEAPSDFPGFTRFLVHEGIDSISLNPHVALQTKMHVVKPAEWERRHRKPKRRKKRKKKK